MGKSTSEAATALAAGKYDDAVRCYTADLKAQPKNIDLLLGRATAYHKAKQYEAALKDAELAAAVAHDKMFAADRARSQFRRGMALYALKRYADAELCFDWASKHDHETKEKALPIWISKAKTALQGQHGVKPDVKERPDVNEAAYNTAGDCAPVVSSTDAREAPKSTLLPTPNASNESNNQLPTTQKTPSEPVSVPAAWKPPKLEWYQNNETVVVSFYAKQVPKDQAVISFQPRSLSLSFPVSETGGEWSHELDPLFAEIDPTASSYRILSSKIEVKLAKKQASLKWTQLEEDASAQPKPASSLLYPTSSKTGSKNWDKVATDAATSAQTDKEEGDALQGLFQTLYKDADDDTKKAMMKSYQESGGTALSTNWKEVSAGKVPVQPPQGMVAKPYEQ